MAEHDDENPVRSRRASQSWLSHSQTSLTSDQDAPQPCELRSFDHSLASYKRRVEPGEPDYGLCERCNAIDFLAIFCIDPNRSKDRAHYMGWSSQKLLDVSLPTEDVVLPTCPLCQLYRLRAGDGDSLFGNEWKLSIRRITWDYTQNLSCNPIVLCLQKDSLGRDTSLLTPTNWCVRQPLLPPAVSPRTEYIHSHSIPYSVFALEIQRCLGTETGSEPQVARGPLPKGMKVIDCIQRKVVEYDGNTDYLTLSYVWGSRYQFANTIDMNDESGGSTLAATIQDAPTVTLNLGKSYLWIDRYCIDQQEPMKAAQINNMSDIFCQSWATIVSLGPDADTQLPGVSARRRKSQLIRTTQCDILSLSKRPDCCIRDSRWNTRAWTFQEGVLSRRVLLFSDSEVFLICDHGVVFESLTGISHIGTSGSVGSFLENPNAFDWANPRNTVFEPHGKLSSIEEYCSRELSYETDSLNAFRGYLKGCGLFSFWGVTSPYTNDGFRLRSRNIHYLDNGICAGMLWHKETPRSRPASALMGPSQPPYVCDLFPSWSWTSCRPDTKTQHIPLDGAPAFWIAKAFLEDVHGSAYSLSAMLANDRDSINPNGSRLIPEWHKQIIIQGRLLELDMVDRRPLSERLLSAWLIPLAVPNIVTTARFHPDQRVCCPRHRDCEAEEACDSALLLHVRVSASSDSDVLATAEWLALRAETKEPPSQDSHQYWHRVGLLTVRFSITRAQHLTSVPQVSDEPGVTAATRAFVREAIKQDIRGNLWMVRLG